MSMSTEEKAEHWQAKLQRSDFPRVVASKAVEDYAALLATAGFSSLASGFCKRMSEKARIAIAQEHYPVIHRNKIDHFADRLRARTEKIQDNKRRYQVLVLDSLPVFNGEAPPPSALEALAEAKTRGVFDHFQVASIKWHEETIPAQPDPILVGRIAGCLDWFVIAQWGHDVTAEEIEAGA
jgi:hypothetical protein